MTIPTTQRRPVARLNFADGEVIVTPKDQDIFLISAENAVEACRNVIRAEERIEQFKSRFLIPLHDWSAARTDKLRACYVTVPGRTIQVFLVTDSPAFDFELAEEVAELERALSQGGWRLSTAQLPATDENALATFFRPEEALEVYAKR